MDDTRTGRYLLVATMSWLQRVLEPTVAYQILTSATFDDCCMLVDFPFHQLHPSTVHELFEATGFGQAVDYVIGAAPGHPRTEFITELPNYPAVLRLITSAGGVEPPLNTREIDSVHAVNVYDNKMFLERLVEASFDLAIVTTTQARIVANERYRVLVQGAYVTHRPQEVELERVSRPSHQRSDTRDKLLQELSPEQRKLLTGRSLLKRNYPRVDPAVGVSVFLGLRQQQSFQSYSCGPWSH